MNLHEIIETGKGTFLEGSRFIKEHKGNIASYVLGAGTIAILSLMLRGCSSPSSEALENIKPKFDITQPARFDCKDNKLYLRYKGTSSTSLEAKRDQYGTVYFQGTEGGTTVLVPARLDSQGRVIINR